MFKHILVALDGSTLAENALTPAVELATSMGSELHLVSVAEGKPGLTDRIIGYEWIGHDTRVEDDIDHLTGYLAGVSEKISAAPPKIHRVVLTGEAASSLVEYATDEGCDVIIICSHGRSGVLRWALGSVADRIVRASIIPVLLIRANATP